ncbi:MAG: ABC transporter permease subunit [Eubacteriales bacterium]|nr:ABC transporter permease subunit [Eubacteriales bacterium]
MKAKLWPGLLSAALLLGSWHLLSLFFPPLVVPPISSVCVSLAEIIGEVRFLSTVFTTLLRLAAGLVIGTAIGGGLGLLFGLNQKLEKVLSPFVGVLQAVPPVCWVVLALVWFGFNGKPCVFIVATAAIPPVAINISGGVKNIDKELLEMARLYGFSRGKTLRHVVLPSIGASFRSAMEIVTGSSWKLVVMGEVLTTNSGIGGAITTARLNLEPERILAWAVILVVFCFCMQKSMAVVFCGKRGAVC